MKSLSTGTGIALLAGAIVAFPFLNRVSSIDRAAQASTAAPAVAMAAMAQTPPEPTIVWMGVTTWHDTYVKAWSYHRLWSDGRLEVRTVRTTAGGDPDCWEVTPMGCAQSQWHELPPPPGGSGFSCRTDINGDRIVDGADLTFVLGSWGQAGGCAPEATYPCLTLGNLGPPS